MCGVHGDGGGAGLHDAEHGHWSPHRLLEAERYNSAGADASADEVSSQFVGDDIKLMVSQVAVPGADSRSVGLAPDSIGDQVVNACVDGFGNVSVPLPNIGWILMFNGLGLLHLLL